MYKGYPDIKDAKRVQSFNCKVSDHPTHSPVLDPTNSLLFLHLKKHLAGQKFHKEVKTAATM
jgi:hypothetical protein